MEKGWYNLKSHLLYKCLTAVTLLFANLEIIVYSFSHNLLDKNLLKKFVPNKTF